MFNVIFIFILVKENKDVNLMVFKLSDFLCYIFNIDLIKKVLLE